MNSRSMLTILLIPLVTPAPAAVTAFSGSAEVEVVERIDGASGATDREALAFPEDTSNLPLQPVAVLIDSEELAAAAVAAQFADPTLLDQPNPEEFALNFAASSISEATSHEINALLRESRSITFTSEELGVANGVERTFIGTWFVDAVFAIVGEEGAGDLTGADIDLEIDVIQTTATGSQTVFSGALALRGGIGGVVTVNAIGDIPPNQVLALNLPTLLDEFGAVSFVSIPNQQFDYTYDAVVGEPFELTTELRVRGATRPDGAAVAGIIGTPIEQIADIVAITQSLTAGEKLEAAMVQEREDPQGSPLAAQQNAQVPLIGPCGGLGFVSVVGLCGLLLASGGRRQLD